MFGSNTVVLISEEKASTNLAITNSTVNLGIFSGANSRAQHRNEAEWTTEGLLASQPCSFRGGSRRPPNQGLFIRRVVSMYSLLYTCLLLQEATARENLAVMYIGWCAYL